MLLLDAVPAAQGTPITVYVTIGAAVLAALASLNATRVSSKTSREVATLASQTARESAKIAAETARELKDTDYKNDFYKKLIEKRLNAWADAERLIKSLADITTDVPDNRSFFTYFGDPKDFIQIVEDIKESILTQMIWIGGNYNDTVIAFRLKLHEIWGECYISDSNSENRHERIDKKLLRVAGKKYHNDMTALYTQMIAALITQLNTLHDIEGFLATFKNP